MSNGLIALSRSVIVQDTLISADLSTFLVTMNQKQLDICRIRDCSVENTYAEEACTTTNHFVYLIGASITPENTFESTRKKFHNSSYRYCADEAKGSFK